VERIGRDHLLVAKIGEHAIRALVNPEDQVENQDQIKLTVRKGRLHLFDGQTEMNLVKRSK
jgi:multiple sugar transport system ATP-binding protein